MGGSVFFRIIFCLVYLTFFNSHALGTREFSLTSVATTCSIVFDALCLCVETKQKSYKIASGVIFLIGITILSILSWTIIKNTQEIEFGGIPYLEIIISKEIMWFILLAYLLSPLTYTFFIRKGEYT